MGMIASGRMGRINGKSKQLQRKMKGPNERAGPCDLAIQQVV